MDQSKPRGGRPRSSEERSDAPFGKALKVLLAKAGLKQAEFARRSFIDPATLSRMMKGEQLDETPARRDRLRCIIKTLHEAKAISSVEEANQLLNTIPTVKGLDERDKEDAKVIEILTSEVKRPLLVTQNNGKRIEDVKLIAEEQNSQQGIAGLVTSQNELSLSMQSSFQGKGTGESSEDFDSSSPVESESQKTVSISKKTQRSISRRKVIGGLIAAATLTSVGFGAFAFVESGRNTNVVRSLPQPILERTYYQYTFQRKPGVVYGVACSPDGSRVASTSTDGTVHIWEVVTGERVLIYQQHMAPVTTIAWSPTGRYIASGDDANTVHIWEASTGKHLVTCYGHVDHVLCVTWSPDSLHVASGGADRDNTVRVWEAMTGHELLKYTGHLGVINGVAWSPDGKQIASASADTTVHIWDASTGVLSYVYHGHTADVHAVAWSPDSDRLASGSFDKTVQSWKVGTEIPLHTYTGHTYWVRTVAWSPNSEWIASGGFDMTMRLWNDYRGSNQAKFVFGQGTEAGYVHCLKWLTNGKQLVAAREHSVVQLWDIP